MEHRHVFGRAELERYFARIALPESKRVYDVSVLADDEKVAFLNLLQKHELCKVPWENITQHYSFHRAISIRPKVLYHKIVNDNGRGGYCMEANYFFHLILISLGFGAHISGSRIFFPHTKTYGGFTHCVNIITIGDTRYLVDGGLGPHGPSHPFPIRDGVVADQIAPAQMRLTKETLPQHLDKSQKVWVYSWRYEPSRDWTPAYCFTELEFLPQDIHAMNFEPWLDPQTFFTHKVVCIRFSTDRETNDDDKPGSPDEDTMGGKINGTMTLNHNVFKWRANGVKQVEIQLQSEKDRVDVLKKYFGIHLSDEDQESITGTSAQLGNPGITMG